MRRQAGRRRQQRDHGAHRDRHREPPESRHRLPFLHHGAVSERGANRQVHEHPGVWQSLGARHGVNQARPLIRRQHAAGVVVELGAQLVLASSGSPPSRGCTPRPLSNTRPSFSVTRTAPLNWPGRRKRRVHVVRRPAAPAPGSRGRAARPRSRRTGPARPRTSASASVYCRHTRQCASVAGATFSATGSHTIDTLNSATGHSIDARRPAGCRAARAAAGSGRCRGAARAPRETA